MPNYNKKKSPGIPGPSNHTHFPKKLSVAAIVPVVVVISTVMIMICPTVIVIPVWMVAYAYVAP